MGQKVLHTPEGVRDIYGRELEAKVVVADKLHKTIQSYGFMDIQTPAFEYFDIFSKEIGTTPSKDLYKFFDKEGNTLVLRPDFTPSMARCAAKYYMEETIPIRFCYQGNTYVNTSELQGKLKEVTEIGAELIGDDSIEADAEMISLVVELCKNAGLKEFQVTIGDVEYFKGLCEEASLTEDVELELKNYISGKNFFGAEEFFKQQEIGSDYKEAFLRLGDLFGSFSILTQAKEQVQNKRSKKAVDRLSKLYELLQDYGIEKYVSVDLGMLNKYQYYTGIIFKAYTYGVGDVIVKGGRYDNLLAQFGKQSPAIGFVIVVDDVLSALTSQKLLPESTLRHDILLYEKAQFQKAISLAKKMRKEGSFLQVMEKKRDIPMERYISFMKNHALWKIVYLNEEGTISEVNEA